MNIQDLKEKIELKINEITLENDINNINNAELAVLSFLVRLLIEAENVENKNSYQWKILHSFLHYYGSKISKKSILKVILNYLSKFEYIRMDILSSLGKYINEFSDKYWSFEDGENKKLLRMDVVIQNIKMVNPVQGIFYVKAQKINDNKSEITFFSQKFLVKENVYQIEIKKLTNLIKQERYFLLNEPTNISQFSTTESNSSNKAIKLIVKYFNSEYPTNNPKFKDISNEEDNKFHWILTDFFNNSNPVKGISNKSKFKILEELNDYGITTTGQKIEKKIEILKMRLHKQFINSTLPFILFPNNLDISSIQKSKYSPIQIGEYLTNEEVKKWISLLINIFYKDINIITEKLFLNINRDKTLFIRPAGHGKSQQIIDFIPSHKDKKIIIFTPTRKAEEIFKEIISQHKNVETAQINKLISDYENSHSNTKRFSTGWEKDYVIFFDEISMYGTQAWEAISKLNDFKQMNFVGDPHQIEPVSKDKIILSHLIETIARGDIKAESSVCEKNWRIDESAKNSKGIKLLLKHILSEKIDQGNKFYRDMLIPYDGYEYLINKLGESNFDDYTIIVPENNGIIGVNYLNPALKGLGFENQFKAGDKVVMNKSYNDNLYNNRTLIITNISNNKNNQLKKFELNNKFEYTEKYGEQIPFSLFKVITAHKAQGQSLNKVVVVVTDSGVINARWLYSAASRAKTELIIFHPDEFEFSKLEYTNKLTNDEKNLLYDFIKTLKKSK